MRKTEVSSLNEHNFSIVSSVAERIENKLNISPNEFRIKIDISDKDEDIQGLEYLESHEAIFMYTPLNEAEHNFTLGFDVLVHPEKFPKLYAELQRYSEVQNLSTTPKISRIAFNGIDTLTCDGVKIDISEGSLSYYVLKNLFQSPYPYSASLTDVTDEWGRTESTNTVNDAVTNINALFRKALKAEGTRLRLVRQKAGYFHFDDKYIDSISTDK